MRLLRRPLAENDFWALIDVMQGRVDEAALARLAVDHITVAIDFAGSWLLRPEIGEPAPSEFGDRLERAVRVTVPAEEVRGWSARQRRTGLAAVAATFLLAVLAGDHAAVPELRRMREAAPTSCLPSRRRGLDGGRLPESAASVIH